MQTMKLSTEGGKSAQFAHWIVSILIFLIKNWSFFWTIFKNQICRFYIQPEFLYAKINSEYDLTYT